MPARLVVSVVAVAAATLFPSFAAVPLAQAQTYDSNGVRVTALRIRTSGSTVDASYTVDVSRKTYFRNLVLAVRDSSGTNHDFIHRNGVTVYPGSPRTFSGSRTLADGSYRAWVAYRKGYTGWFNLAPRKTFAVDATPEPPPPSTDPTPPPGGPWTLAFVDEFNGTALDTTKWETKYGGRSGQMQYANPRNGEAQWYKPENCVLAGDGYLRQRAKREGTTSPYTGQIFNYSSCLITSRPSFNTRYGHMEARVKLPKGSGFWPAYWTWPANEQWPPEVDIFEFYGDNPTLLYLTYHDETSGATGTRVSATDWAADWHTVAVDWEPGKMSWYVDGVERKVVYDDPGLSMYLIANLAICDGSRCPAPNSSTPFPSDYILDYVRVWKRG